MRPLRKAVLPDSWLSFIVKMQAKSVRSGPREPILSILFQNTADYPLYAHVGGANQPGPADALGQMDSYGWTDYNDLNQFSIGFPTFWRDYGRLPNVATEHTMYSSVDKLLDYAATNRGLTNVDKDGNSWDKNFVPYQFTDDAPASQRPLSQSIHLEFWTSDPNYYVDWTYNPKTNLYARVKRRKTAYG